MLKSEIQAIALSFALCGDDADNPVILDRVHAEERDTGDRIILCSIW